MSRGAAPYPSRKFQWKNTTKHGGHFPPPDHSQFITIQNFIRVFRGYRTAARPPNGDGCHPACIALASGLFAAGGCGVPVPQAFMGIGKTQKGLPVPPRLLHRFTGSPETFCGALLNAAHWYAHTGERKKTGKETIPIQPWQAGNARNTLSSWRYKIVSI